MDFIPILAKSPEMGNSKNISRPIDGRVGLINKKI